MEKTGHVILVVEVNDFIIATTDILSGNRNDAYQLVNNLQTTFQSLKAYGRNIQGSYFNGDKAFDTQSYRKTFLTMACFPTLPRTNGIEKRKNECKEDSPTKQFTSHNILLNKHLFGLTSSKDSDFV